MAIIHLDTIPQVTIAFMNSDHREQARLLNAVGESLVALRTGTTSRGEVQRRFAALHAYTRGHFAREESDMQRGGFPPYPIHKAEHDHVLAEMAEEGSWFATHGDAERLWAYVAQAVPAWFLGHIQSLDLVTARFLTARAARAEALPLARVTARSRR